MNRTYADFERVMNTREVMNIGWIQNEPLCLSFSSDKSECDKRRTIKKIIISKKRTTVVLQNKAKTRYVFNMINAFIKLFLRTNFSKEVLWI